MRVASPLTAPSGRARWKREFGYSVVAEFALSGQTFEPVAAALVVRFEAAGFVDFQHQIFVFVLAVDDEFHFNQRLARQKPSVLNRNAFVLRDLL